MSLYARLLGTEQPKIAIHYFCAALGERVRTKITDADIFAYFNLNADEQAEFTALFSKVSLLQTREIEDVFVLGEAKFSGYDNDAALKTRFAVVSL